MFYLLLSEYKTTPIYIELRITIIYEYIMNRVILFVCLCFVLFGCSDFDSRKEADTIPSIDEKYRFAYDAIESGPDYEYFKYPVTDWKFNSNYASF